MKDRAFAPGLLQFGIMVLTAGTAAIHVTLRFPDALFIANALGYVTLLALLYLPISPVDRYRHAVRFALFAYTALTVLLWYLLAQPAPIGYLTKGIEVALLLLVWMEARQAYRAAALG